MFTASLFSRRWRPLPWIWLVALLAIGPCMALLPAAAHAQTPSDALRGKYAALEEQLKNNAFQRPFYLESEELPNRQKGDVYAVVDYPVATVDTALDNPAHWCDILILHLNIKYCKAGGSGSAPVISINLGKKNPQELKDTYRADFQYRKDTTASDYFSVMLSAAHGPLNTSNYRIHLEAVGIDAAHSFLHLTYSYEYGLAGKMAMKAYLSTVGSNKLGFTRVPGSDGKPDAYIRGVRGVVERNTMRYYLAIDAYLSAMKAPPSEQFEKRIQTWFSATERYPRQLHEIDRAEYLDMKRAEYQRQNTDAR